MLKPDEIRLKHRDLNWLSFNERVLQEAQDPSNPLYERLKFLAIFSTNLDEYFRVRVSQLRQIKRVEKSLRKKLALKPSRKVKEILQRVREQQARFGNIYYEEILPELEQNGIHIIGEEQLTTKQKAFCEEHYKKITSFVHPALYDLEKDQELFLKNNELYFLVTFTDESKFGIINIPVEESGRFLSLEPTQGKHHIIFIDNIVKMQIPSVFPDLEIAGIFQIKLSRDAELYIDDEVEGILAEKIYKSLKQRTNGQPTRLLYDAEMPKEVQKQLRKLLGLGKIDMMPGGKFHNFGDFFAFPDPTDNSSLHYKSLPPVNHRILESSTNYFREISKRDIAVHFPYHSFNYVERFLEEAANDEKVEEIKISIYRIAEDSKLTSTLMKAIENGKKVTVFIEAKARFDEKNNIDWGRKFEENGAKVIYSYPKIKVHSKILFVARREEDRLQRYAYIGTGNFNSQTAAIYCDHAIFTAHKRITKEIARIFLVLEGELIVPREKNLLISPFSTRKKFNDLIIRETEHALEGKKAGITAKINSLEDSEIIELLYKASNAGVKIRLLVRGFTCLIPGVKGMSENIYVTSIVDRYLEHGRIFVFENNGEEEIYFGSADWMTRNLDRRIEVIAPIYDKEIANEFKDILDLQLKDNVKARVQDALESNEYVQKSPGEKVVRSQVEIYNYLKEKHER